VPKPVGKTKKRRREQSMQKEKGGRTAVKRWGFTRVSKVRHQKSTIAVGVRKEREIRLCRKKLGGGDHFAGLPEASYPKEKRKKKNGAKKGDQKAEEYRGFHHTRLKIEFGKDISKKEGKKKQCGGTVQGKKKNVQRFF